MPRTHVPQVFSYMGSVTVLTGAVVCYLPNSISVEARDRAEWKHSSDKDAGNSFVKGDPVTGVQ